MDNKLAALLERTHNGTADEQDYAELLELIRRDESGNTGRDIQSFHNLTLQAGETYSAEEMHALFAGILKVEKIAAPSPVHRVHFLRKWGWAAASVVLLLAAGAYLYTHMTKKGREIVPVLSLAAGKDILPGRDGAILTLADGSTVVLDSLGGGVIATQDGATVVLTKGQLAYNPAGGAAAQMVWNTMSTPRGRQFRLVLPDGTKVWLNTASSIRYPTVFHGRERKVEITGEAYFEVAKNEQLPFRVSINKETEVQVLGTHFNINAYADEPAIKATLLEGSVKVVKGNDFKLLQPGEQAVVKGGIVLDKNVNVQQAISWKNGLFNFEGASLDEFLRQLARWYDIKIVYKGKVPQRTFQGELGRDLVLSDILETLTYFKINYKIEGKTLIIE